MDPVWEQIFQTRAWGKYPPEHVVRFVASNFYKRAQRHEVRILDVGCGTGACTWFIAKEGFSVSAIDGSPTAVRIAQERLKEEKLTAEFKIGDFTQLPWPNDYFDAAVDNFSLYANLANDWKRAVDEVYRVLKLPGLFLTASFTTDCWGHGTGREVENGTFTSIPEGPLQGRGLCHFVDNNELREIMRDFPQVSVERESRTLCNGRKVIDTWVCTALKQA